MRGFEEILVHIIGAGIGTLAHFGNMLARGSMPSLAHVIGFLMQLGMIVLGAVIVTEFIGLESDNHKMAASGVIAISANEIITYIKQNGWKRLFKPWLPDEKDS